MSASVVAGGRAIGGMPGVASVNSSRNPGASTIDNTGRILPTYTVPGGRSAVPFRSGRSSQNVKPALKWLTCPNCHGRAVRIGLVTHHHLFLRCDDCGEPLSLPERRRGARKLSKIP
jgi:hypothetical protein